MREIERAWILVGLAVAISVATAPSAWADHLEQIISFRCYAGENRIIIDHKWAFDKAGDLLVKGIHGNEWNIRTLVDGKKVERSCYLQRHMYEVTISGVYWGEYGQDESGDQTAHVTIKTGSTTLFDANLMGNPFSGPSPIPVISRIVVSVGAGKPQVSTMTTYWW